MWDEQDHFSRWVQGICGLLLLGLAITMGSLSWPWSRPAGYSTAEDSLAFGALYLAYRCFRYALSGRDNINRDDF